jgi:glycerol kinase
MPTDAEQAAIIKTQTLAVIATITATPKPSYIIDGQTVLWGAYLKQLQDQVKWADGQINSETPYEEHSQGFTT